VALAALSGPLVAAEPVAPAPAAPPAPPAAAGPAADGQTGADDLDRQFDEARQRLEAASREYGELAARRGDRMVRRFELRRFGGEPPRVLLGMMIGMDRSDGVAVLSVSPGGAAEKAGIKAGDLLTAVGGKSLTDGGDIPANVRARLHELEPEKPVKLKLLRDGKSREVEITPRAAPPMQFSRQGPGPQGLAVPPGPGGRAMQPLLPGPGMVPQIRPFGRGPDDAEWRGGEERGHGFAGLELATLSPELGRYFGAKAGVLVVRAGREAALKLQDGDVITAIDGREPESSTHATRILRSYQRGEKLKLSILRDRKPMTLEATLPGG
jgi:membrane-associated protease RseP (regulator of RpoE activity)